MGLKDFAGQWRLSRTITDHHSERDALFVGTAVFTPDDLGLAYFESGTLTLAGQPPFHAERRYHWRQEASGLQVYFEDGRFFHNVDPTDPKATHWCDPDTYNVTYDFNAWPGWTSTWDVSGPKKAYKMRTTYARLAAADS